MSTPIDSLQVIDKYDIVAIDSAWTTPWNPFFAESGGTAQPAVPTGAPRFRTALRRFRRGMDLGPHSPAGIAAQLGVRFPGLPGHAGAGMPRQTWKTNTQLSSNTSGGMRPQIHPTAEPTKRCSKSRRTSWNSRLRRSTRFCKKRVPGSRPGTVNGHNIIFINNLQRVDRG